MPLKKTDDIGDWIKDFYKSDAPQFKNASKEKRRKMAVAAYLSAQEAIQSVFENDEYDAEGKMSKSQLKTLLDAAQQLHDMLADDTNMPEWVQSKITKATDYIDTARDYMQSELEDGKGPVGENKAYNKGVAADKKDDRDAHFDKQAKMSDDDPKAYKPAPGDKDKDGEMKKTKVSKHTKKYRQMYGEEKIEEKIAGLEKKAKKSGISYGILKQVYDRGMAAWKTGHRPGASQQQWAFARVNSFITKGSGTWGKADKDLAAKVRKEEMDTRTEMVQRMLEVKEKNKGLWANVHAKRKRGEAPAKPGDKDYPEKLPEESVEESLMSGSMAKTYKRDAIIKHLRKTMPKKDRKKDLYFDDADLVYRDKTIVANAVGPNSKSRISDLEKAVSKIKEEVQPVDENKLKDLAIQFADEMKPLSRLIKNRKDRVAAEVMAKRVEKGDMRAAAAAFQNLSPSSRALVAGAFASLFGDTTAKKHGITEDDTSSYVDYISKTLYK